MKQALVVMKIMIAVVPDLAHGGELEAYGRRLVEANCAQCHAIGLEGASAHLDAPALRDLSGRYPIDALEEAFAEGIYVGHPDMPEFEATPEQIDAILAYIQSIW